MAKKPVPHHLTFYTHEEAEEAKNEQTKRRKKYGLTEHHRRPRRDGGTSKKGNVSLVGRPLHEAYHMHFGVYQPDVVRDILLQRLAPSDETLLLIPTHHSTVLIACWQNTQQQYLRAQPLSEFGITKGHLRFHGTKLEQKIYKTMIFLPEENLRTPDKGLISRKVRGSDRRSAYFDLLFPDKGLSAVARELTQFWLPLSVVMIAVPVCHYETMVKDTHRVRPGAR